MAYREVRVVDCLEVLRRWLAGDGIRQIARSTGLDRKTVRRFIGAAAEVGLKASTPWPDERVVAEYLNRVKPPRTGQPAAIHRGHGQGSPVLESGQAGKRDPAAGNDLATTPGPS